MKLPRDLSGEDLAAILMKYWAYSKVHQAGSHIALQTEQPTSHRVAVPAHRALRVGTLNAIISAVAAHKKVPKETILEDIWSYYRAARLTARKRESPVNFSPVTN
jgi:predicted RNA binding protein YcfA (HicA-like mRNA interferase family)